MAVLDDIKIFLGISDTSKDALLNLLIRKGTTLITNYMNAPIDGKSSLILNGVKYESTHANSTYSLTIVQGIGVSVPTSGDIDASGNLVITLGTDASSNPLVVTASDIGNLVFTGDGTLVTIDNSALITVTVVSGATVQVVSPSETLIPTILADVPVVYADALIEYVIECYRKKGNEGIKSFSQGSRSGTYTNELSDSVKALLPPPYIKMMGVKRRYVNGLYY